MQQVSGRRDVAETENKQCHVWMTRVWLRRVGTNKPFSNLFVFFLFAFIFPFLKPTSSSHPAGPGDKNKNKVGPQAKKVLSPASECPEDADLLGRRQRKNGVCEK
jgi:hypothetical protein